jgi:type I restriction-modification system DNA methylase subunit
METVIDKIRGILRKEGVTGMDSINHCIIFVIARMLDENKCKKFGIDEKNSYYNIMHDEDGDLIDAQELYGRVFTENDKLCLVGQIRNKLKFSNIKFKLESPQHVEQIMKELEKLDMTKLENKYDIIGTIYEYHLKSGTSNAMRDLGQYYTNRLVIEFMIKLCDIKMNKKGEIDTIIDPTMGTGGFLTMAVKYLNDKYKNKIDWTKNKNRVYGFDIDDNVKNMALLNMLLECGEMCEETFIKNDTLYNDFKLKNGDILEKVDVILANEPMGIKNIIHASCCERIKELKIRGTKAEPLFLQLFMTSLNEGGRCAVIVPDGVLFNDSNLHNDTRKYLVENCNLKKVIGLNDDFFLNTGVKTSILFFVKDGKTTEVEFSELKLNKNEVVENSIIKVDYKKIVDTGYSLFVNKYNATEIVKIEGVKYEKLGDVCEIKFGKRIKKDEVEVDKDYNGIRYPCYGGGDISFYMKEYNREGKNLVISRFALSKCCVRIINNKFWLNDSGFTLHTKNNKLVMQDYLNYIMLNKQEEIYNLSAGACQKNIVMEDFNKLEIPIPSLEVQQKIVEQLDVIYKNIKTCKEQIEESKKIMKYYVETMTLWEDSKKLGDLCDIKSGKFNSKDKKESGKYPFYNSEVNNPVGYIDEYCFDYDKYIILIKDGGAGQGKYGDQIGLGKVFRVAGKSGATSHQYALHINNKIIINDYLYFYLMSIKNRIMDLAQYTTGLGCIRKSDFENIKIPIPSLDKQKEIVEHCDELNATIKSMESRIKSNEMLMKNIMETYLKTNDKNKDEKKSDKQTIEPDDDKEIDQKPVKKIKQKIVKKVESSSEEESSSSDSSSESDLKPKKKLVKRTK